MMKAIITFIMILFFGSSVHSSGLESFLGFYKIKGYVDVEKDLKLNNLYLNMPYSKLIEIMGKESKRTESRDLGEDGFDFDLIYNDGTIINMLNDEVFSIEVTSNKYQTPRGLRVGDTMDKVIDLYKFPEYQEENEWNYTSSKDYIYFSVSFKDDKVIKIMISMVM